MLTHKIDQMQQIMLAGHAVRVIQCHGLEPALAEQGRHIALVQPLPRHNRRTIPPRPDGEQVRLARPPFTPQSHAAFGPAVGGFRIQHPGARGRVGGGRNKIRPPESGAVHKWQGYLRHPVTFVYAPLPALFWGAGRCFCFIKPRHAALRAASPAVKTVRGNPE